MTDRKVTESNYSAHPPLDINHPVGAVVFLRMMLAIMRATTNILTAGGAGPDTIGFNAMLIVAGMICITTGAGRNYGIDRFLLARWPSLAFLRLIA